MKVLYVTNFQGDEAVAQRRLHRNRALGASAKVDLIARSLARRGHEVTVLSLATPAERTGRFYRGFSVEGSPRAPFRTVYLPAIDLPIANRLSGFSAITAWICSHRDWDVALVYNLSFDAVALASLLHLLRVPVAFEYEDDATATLEHGARANSLGEVALTWARAVAAGAVVVNEELQRQLAVPNSTVVQGVVDDDLFRAPSRIPMPNEPLRLLYSGGLTLPKGIDLLIEAAASLEMPYVLTVTGDGPLAGLVRSAAQTNGRIRFLGSVPREALVAELVSCDVCVNPHRMASGQVGTLFPFKIAEYLASGAQVVSSDLGAGPPAILGGVLFYHGDDALALAAAIKRASAECSSRELLRSAARSWVEAHLSASAVGRCVEAVLEKARAV